MYGVCPQDVREETVSRTEVETVSRTEVEASFAVQQVRQALECDVISFSRSLWSLK